MTSKRKHRKSKPALPEKRHSDDINSSATTTIKIASVQQTEHYFQGPLPHPSILKAYDLVLPGLAERIITAWEKQTDHRMRLERTVIDGDNKRANWGLVCATAISIIVVIACVVIATLNKELSLAAFGVIVLNMATLAGAFLYGSQSRKKEREKKAAQVKESTSTK